jgi:DNA-binding response OmpR family regulator
VRPELLPESNAGPEVASSIRHLPVIMLSGTTNVEDIKRACGVPANSYLIKRSGFEELVEMLKAINLDWSSLTVHPDP